MYQTIHEEISVAGVYQHQQFIPRKFLWKGKTIIIDKITLRANLKEGGRKQRWYSVVNGVNVYRLLFDREDEVWWLEEVWVE